MATLIVIFAGFGVITVITGLATFLRHVQSAQRLSIISLLSTGVILIVIISLYVHNAESNSFQHGRLCNSAQENRIALRATIQFLLTQESKETLHPDGGTLRAVSELIQGPAC